MQLYLLETVVLECLVCVSEMQITRKKIDGWELGPSGMKTFLTNHGSGLSGSLEGSGRVGTGEDNKWLKA